MSWASAAEILISQINEDDDEDENDFDDFHRFAGFRKMCRTDNISSRLARSSLLRRKGLFENIQL